MILESLSCTEVLAYLRNLCQKQSTGTLFVIQEGHLRGRIGLHKGEVISLHGKSTKGRKSISEVNCSGEGRDNFAVSFTDGAIPSERMDLPATAEILALLDGSASAHASPQAAEQRSPGAADARAILEQTLREFVGPIAAMICDECFSSTTDLDTAIDTLTAEIPDPQTAARFRRQMRERLIG